MKAFRESCLLVAIVALAGCVHPRGVDVGVRASGEIAPGVYGRVDVRNRPPPPVVYSQPVIVVQQPRHAAPVYLHVPPGHAKKWDKHCHKYDACGVPVYFVKSAEYEPGYKRPKRGKGKDRDDDDDDDDDDDRRGRRR
ncbi:MAG: hypothetical protein OEZ09_12550 [Betaproteobacteria bacterium]|nr:hypothetical protein [Betaproteobacteria bacterium]MDH5579276.1 hypothetical protein [Betaproteobacteria bacterium]